jgi:hypothetical protein
MCHIHHHQTLQQARLTASQPCQPDDLTVVSLTVGGFCQRAGIQIGSGQVNRSTGPGLGILTETALEYFSVRVLLGWLRELRALPCPPGHAVRWLVATLVCWKAWIFKQGYCHSVRLLCRRTEKKDKSYICPSISP